MSGRIVCRYSSGGPSAVVVKLAVAAFGAENVFVVKSDTRSEHPDNERFDREVSEWAGKEVTYLASSEYQDIWDVFRRRHMILNRKRAFAPCRPELKQVPFYDWWLPSDTLLFGYTADKRDAARADRLQKTSAETMRFPLIERGLLRSDCLSMIERAGIEIPMMYRLGFHNNNCLGCPKGGMGYWNLIRIHFPDRFEEMCCIQDDLGPESWFLKRRGELISLRMLRPEDGNHDEEQDIECSVMCALAEQEFAA